MESKTEVGMSPRHPRGNAWFFFIWSFSGIW